MHTALIYFNSLQNVGLKENICSHKIVCLSLSCAMFVSDKYKYLKSYIRAMCIPAECLFFRLPLSI
jgi:hypothetical protein